MVRERERGIAHCWRRNRTIRKEQHYVIMLPLCCLNSLLIQAHNLNLLISKNGFKIELFCCPSTNHRSFCCYHLFLPLLSLLLLLLLLPPFLLKHRPRFCFVKPKVSLSSNLNITTCSSCVEKDNPSKALS